MCRHIYLVHTYLHRSMVTTLLILLAFLSLLTITLTIRARRSVTTVDDVAMDTITSGSGYSRTGLNIKKGGLPNAEVTQKTDTKGEAYRMYLHRDNPMQCQGFEQSVTLKLHSQIVILCTGYVSYSYHT